MFCTLLGFIALLKHPSSYEREDHVPSFIVKGTFPFFRFCGAHACVGLIFFLLRNEGKLTWTLLVIASHELANSISQ